LGFDFLLQLFFSLLKTQELTEKLLLPYFTSTNRAERKHVQLITALELTRKERLWLDFCLFWMPLFVTPLSIS